MKTYTFESTTKSKSGTGRELIAMGTFKGPGGNVLPDGKDDDKANDAEFAAWRDATVEVTAWVLNPPVQSDANGAYQVPESAKVAVAPYHVNNFEAWLYGTGLKASGKVRQIATQGEVDDHILSIGRQNTDLDSLTPEQLVKTLNGLRSAIAAGMGFGPSNEAKIQSKLTQAAAEGVIEEVDGTLVVKGARKNGRK